MGFFSYLCSGFSPAHAFRNQKKTMKAAHRRALSSWFMLFCPIREMKRADEIPGTELKISKNSEDC
jgi:hypothetical protein